MCLSSIAFPRYSDILVENCEFFIANMSAPEKWHCRNFASIYIHAGKLEPSGYQVFINWWYIKSFSRNTSVWPTSGQLDGQTDRRDSNDSLYISCVMLSASNTYICTVEWWRCYSWCSNAIHGLAVSTPHTNVWDGRTDKRTDEHAMLWVR